MRKCKFKMNLLHEFEEGVFHQWGNDYDEIGENVGNFTVAIVEDKNGEINRVSPIFIQFTEGCHVLPVQPKHVNHNRVMERVFSYNDMLLCWRHSRSNLKNKSSLTGKEYLEMIQKQN